MGLGSEAGKRMPGWSNIYLSGTLGGCKFKKGERSCEWESQSVVA